MVRHPPNCTIRILLAQMKKLATICLSTLRPFLTFVGGISSGKMHSLPGLAFGLGFTTILKSSVTSYNAVRYISENCHVLSCTNQLEPAFAPQSVYIRSTCFCTCQPLIISTIRGTQSTFSSVIAVKGI